MEAPCGEIGEVVSEPRPEIVCRVGGDAIPALKGSGIGVQIPVSAECASEKDAKLGGNAKTFVLCNG